MCRHPRFLASLPALALALQHSPAAADDPPEPTAIVVAAAPDDLSGHLLLSPRLGLLFPLGSADSATSQTATTSSGPSFGLDLAYGISRHVDVHARFDYGLIGQGDGCPAGHDCSARSLAVGAGLGYHLVNGASFDPWLQAGIGYRRMSFSHAGPAIASQSRTYAGFEWLHLAMGADWYAARSLAVGPYAALDFGSYGSLPSDARAGTSFHTFVSFGLRGTFDPMR